MNATSRTASRFLRSVVGVAGLGLLAACSASMNAEDYDQSSDEVVGSHVYAKPSLPTVSYTPPTTNVIYVSAASGNDSSGTGASTAPYKTLGKAVAIVNAKAAGATWTIVLKAGQYREGELTVTRDNVTIQRYLTDAVSIYGSTSLSGFSGSGPYTLTVSSADSRLEQNCADTGLDTASDYKADEGVGVWRAGIPLRRVTTGTTPAAGQYTYDESSNKLTLADNPSAGVEFAAKLYAIKTAASGFKVAGLDVEYYGSCTVNWTKTVGSTTYYKGALVVYKNTEAASGATIENSTIANNSSGAIAMAKADNVTISGSEIVNNGLDGIQGGSASGLVVLNNDVSYNNVRRWSNSTQAGMKLTYIQQGAVVGNVFGHNAANGFWCDQSCGSTDLSKGWFTISRNVFHDNDGKGVFYEVSHHAVIASNVAYNNGSPGIAAFGSRNVEVWNNTAVDNNTSNAGYLANIAIDDDSRCAQGDTLPGGSSCGSGNTVPEPLSEYDHCVPSSSGALANTCNAEHAQIVNNIVSGTDATQPLLLVEDTSSVAYGGSLVADKDDYNTYWRKSTSAPTNLIGWQTKGKSGFVGYASLTSFKSAVSGRETNSIERSGGTAPTFFVDYTAKNFTQNTSNTDVWGRGATIPSEVLNAIYWPSTSPTQPSARIGAIDWAGKSSSSGGGGGGTGTTCSTSSPVYEVENPSTGAFLFTTSSSEVTSAKASGYTTNDGTAFHAFTASATGLTPVYRLLNPTSHDRLWTTSSSEASSAKSKYGYTTDEGIGFYAATASGSCFVAVHRLTSGGKHTYTTDTAEVSSLVAAGWDDEGIHFYASAS
ncbi:MAG TPA: right-handed parallel beta-helix repeat-containing protein [Polyangiaceae bacterium]